MLLTGCSKGNNVNADVTVKWDNGVIYMNGKATEVTSYNGYSATIENGNLGLTYLFSLDNAKDVTNISVNTQQILEENMDKLKGKFYYSEYLGTKLTMASNVGGDDWIVCQVYTDGNPTATVANFASNYIDTLQLTNNQVYVDFGEFEFGNTSDVVEVRTDGAVITGVAKVSREDKNCVDPVTIIQNDKEYHLTKRSAGNYEYYAYNGYTITMATGLDINNYITFK
jgi:hypothetical protein